MESNQNMIINPARAGQIIDFKGLLFGTGYPTDIDGMIEWHNKCYVLFELKTKGVEPRLGQRLALERLCDDLDKVKPAILILAEHETPVNDRVYAANAIVSKYRYGGEWKTKWTGHTLKEIVTDFLEFVGE